MDFSSIEDVRNRIDQIDSEMVKMIAQRSQCVKAAAAFKSDHSAVRAPDRVQQVIDKVSKQATEIGLPAGIIEKVYRTMIDAFIDYELRQLDELQQEKC
ncbi:chorismate mutase [Enterobacter cloacae]|uniref:chorismate mutase n=1 Tax=Enterobacter cloacae TaxID=550 RepID=UPI003754D12E